MEGRCSVKVKVVPGWQGRTVVRWPGLRLLPAETGSLLEGKSAGQSDRAGQARPRPNGAEAQRQRQRGNKRACWSGRADAIGCRRSLFSTRRGVIRRWHSPGAQRRATWHGGTGEAAQDRLEAGQGTGRRSAGGDTRSRRAADGRPE